MSFVGKAGIIGTGSWGTALGVLLASNNYEVTMWSAIPEEIDMLNEKRELVDKLPGVKLPETMIFTKELKESIEGMDFLVLAVPSVFTRSTAKRMKEFVADKQIIVNVAKGIEEDTLMTQSDIVEDEIPQANVTILCGPSHAEEVGRGMPTTVVVGAHDENTAKYIQKAFDNDRFRVYTSPDMLGMEIGASLKNVIALAAGIADGLGCGDNTKAALITRGIAEISRLGVAMGGKIETFAGLTGIGDLIVTCASMHSRNRRAGILMGQGKTMKEAMDEVKMVVEGVYSAKAAIKLGQKYGIELPIVEQVNKILFEDKKASDCLKELMTRDAFTENKALKWE